MIMILLSTSSTSEAAPSYGYEENYKNDSKNRVVEDIACFLPGKEDSTSMNVFLN
jgi:hypothetical protein